MTLNNMSGAEAVIRALVDNGVEVIFGYPGGAVLPLYDALFENKKIKHILVRHEQAAVHAAGCCEPDVEAAAVNGMGEVAV